jgi:hypothetical protein
MPLNSVPFIKSSVTGQFRLPGQYHRAAGRRAGALFFALHRDYFVVTRNFTAVYLDLLPSLSFTVTRNSLPLTGTGKKQVTATQTAPNQTAGPLGLREVVHLNISKLQVFSCVTIFMELFHADKKVTNIT